MSIFNYIGSQSKLVSSVSESLKQFCFWSVKVGFWLIGVLVNYIFWFLPKVKLCVKILSC